MEHEQHARKIEKIIAKAWMDEGFKQRLVADPAKTLKEQGVETPAGVKVQVVENTAKMQYLVLPMKPPSAEMSDEQLKQVAAGTLTPIPHPPHGSGGSLGG